MMDDIPMNVTDLEPILQAIIRQNITLHEDEIKMANINLKSVLLGRIEKEMRKDETFQTLYKEPQYVGSYYENLRVGHPNEFDINLELELPIKGENITIDTSETEPGFTKIKVDKVFKQRTPDAVKRKVESWLEYGYLNRENVIKWLQGIVDKALTRITWPRNMTVRRSISGPAVTLHVESNGDKFDVDLVPVFRFNRDKWPSRPLRQSHDIPRNIDTSSLKWCVVPKSPRSAPSSNFQWRMSFYMIEKELMRDLNNMKPVIKLFKLLRDKQEWGGLSSYYIKTLFMWEQEKTKNIFWFWRKPLSYLFMHMLNVLEECLQKRRIKFFWHEKCNLIDHLNRNNISNMAGRIKYLKNLIHKALRDEMGLQDVMDRVFTTPSVIRSSRSPSLQEESSWSPLTQEESSWSPLTQEESSWSPLTQEESSRSPLPQRHETAQATESSAGSWIALIGGIAALTVTVGTMIYQNMNNNNRNNN